jgi:hypothetical protein
VSRVRSFLRRTCVRITLAKPEPLKAAADTPAILDRSYPPAVKARRPRQRPLILGARRPYLAVTQLRACGTDRRTRVTKTCGSAPITFVRIVRSLDHTSEVGLGSTPSVGGVPGSYQSRAVDPRAASETADGGQVPGRHQPWESARRRSDATSIRSDATRGYHRTLTPGRGYRERSRGTVPAITASARSSATRGPKVRRRDRFVAGVSPKRW